MKKTVRLFCFWNSCEWLAVNYDYLESKYIHNLYWWILSKKLLNWKYFEPRNIFVHPKSFIADKSGEAEFLSKLCEAFWMKNCAFEKNWNWLWRHWSSCRTILISKIVLIFLLSFYFFVFYILYIRRKISWCAISMLHKILWNVVYYNTRNFNI